jgi:hypothetical protein
MAKDEDFGFQSFHIYPSRSLKTVAISFDHDPILFSTANPADEVFGRHRGMHLKARHGGRAFFVSTYVSSFSSKAAPFAGRGLPAVAHRATR